MGSNQDRDVILNRILMELGILFGSRNGLTVGEISSKLRSLDPDLDFNERTIRRDCEALLAFELVEPRSADTRTWRVRASNRPIRIRQLRHSVGEERDVILGRVLTEIYTLLNDHRGLTVREVAKEISMNSSNLDFNERTVRRDCAALEYHGLLEPRCEEQNVWRIKASDLLKKWFRI